MKTVHTILTQEKHLIAYILSVEQSHCILQIIAEQSNENHD